MAASTLNAIFRDVYILSQHIIDPIEYVRLTNGSDIILQFRDIDIPKESTADVVVIRPDGTGIQNEATVIVEPGNAVGIEVKDTMFSVLGTSYLQVRITYGDSVIVNFAIPVHVRENYTEGDYPPSQNTGGFFDEAQEALDDVKEASEKANKAVENAQTAVENANKAVSDAQTAVSNAQEAANAANEAANAANEAAQGIDTKVQQAVDSAVTPEALQPAVNNYFDSNPVLVDCTPTVEGTTLVFPDGISPTPGASIEQDVANLKRFAGQFDNKTLYTE